MSTEALNGSRSITETSTLPQVDSVVHGPPMAADQEISDEKTEPEPKRTDEKMEPKLDTTSCPFCGGDLKNIVTVVPKIADYVG